MTDVTDQNETNFRVHTNISLFNDFLSDYSSLLLKKEEQFAKLSAEMYEHHISNRQSEEEFNRKMNFCKLMKNAIQRHCPNWVFDIVPTGSTVTGLAGKNSDLDVAIHIPQAAQFFFDEAKREVDIRKASLNILQIVRRILENDETIKYRIKQENPYHVQLVPAQIQILKIYTYDGIECDLSVVVDDFLSSMHNSFLLRHFVQADQRFAPLCTIVKEWADRTEVKKPKEGGFNSYALVLLVIHFLQCGTYPPILPHLPRLYEKYNFFALSEHRFPLALDFSSKLPEPIPEISPNPRDVAMLFFEFLHYYYKFKFNINYISMCKAQVLKRREGKDRQLKIHENKEVYIEDPFDEHNPGRTVRLLKAIKIKFVETMKLFVHDDKFPRLQDIFNMKIEIKNLPAELGDAQEEEEQNEDLSKDFETLSTIQSSTE